MTLTSHRAPVTDAPAPSTAPERRRPRRIRWGRIVAWAILGIVLLITLFPFYWMLRTALSNNNALYLDPGNLLPVDPTLGGFRRVLGLATPEEAAAEGGTTGSINFWLYLRNSVIVSTVITAGQVLFSSMAAYAFARLTWKGRDIVFFIFLTAMMIPPIFVQLPNFILIRDLGLLNTLAGIILPFFFMTPFAIFFMRQFFLGIPRELFEAARVDGASYLRMFRAIALPLARPALVIVFVFELQASWSDLMKPLIYLQTPDYFTMPRGLKQIVDAFALSGEYHWEIAMAATLIATVPMIVIFAFTQRYVLDGIATSAKQG